MAYAHYINNPSRKIVNDSVVRAISIAIGEDWQKTYIGLAIQGFFLHDMPNSSAVYSTFLSDNGFKCFTFKDYHEDYTVDDFILNHPKGIYVLSCDGYLVTVINGTYYDYQELMNIGEVASAMFLRKMICGVDKELAKAEKYQLTKEAVNYDIGHIMSEQHAKHEKYKCKIHNLKNFQKTY